MLATTLAVLGLPAQLGALELPRADLPKLKIKALPSAPNLILVIVDTVRADALELDGNGILAPLAAESIVFEECVNAAPWTLPSVSSILTGQLPSQHGAIDATRVLPEDIETLADQLRAVGYQTAAFTGGAFVSSTFQLDQGFEHFDETAEFGFRPFRLRTPLAWRLVKNRFLPVEPILRWVHEHLGFGGVCDAAAAWLEQRDPERPYFLLLHTYEVHDYYLHHARTDIGIDAADFDVSPRFERRLSVHPSELEGATQNDLDYFRAIYDRRLAHVETQLTRFLGSLEETGGRERVLVITSDHGGRLQDDLVHVPLLVHAPAVFGAGRRIASQVRSVDLTPTLLQLAGARLPERLAGRPLFRGGSDGELDGDLAREAWCEEHANGRDLIGLRQHGWKLLRERGSESYFDLERDPLEQVSVAAAPSDLVQLLDRFEELFPPRAAELATIDDTSRQHLEALGYLDGE